LLTVVTTGFCAAPVQFVVAVNKVDVRLNVTLPGWGITFTFPSVKVVCAWETEPLAVK
jgi:hypothetical protein